MIFTDDGRCYWLKVHEIPVGGRDTRGKPIVNLINVGPDTRIRSMVAVREFRDDQYLFFCTRNGTVKKTALADYGNVRATGIKAVKIEDDDELIDVQITSGTNDVVLATKHGLSVRFPEADVRAMGRDTTGVKGVTLRPEDKVVSMVVVRRADATLLVVTGKGMGKVTDLSEYRVQGRGGKGILTLNRTDKTGNVVAGARGGARRGDHAHHEERRDHPLAGQPGAQHGRNAQGVKLGEPRRQGRGVRRGTVVSRRTRATTRPSRCRAPRAGCCSPTASPTWTAGPTTTAPPDRRLPPSPRTGRASAARPVRACGARAPADAAAAAVWRTQPYAFPATRPPLHSPGRRSCDDSVTNRPRSSPPPSSSAPPMPLAPAPAASESPAAPAPLVTLDDLRRAAAGLRGVAVRTPLLPAADALPPGRAGGDVWLKPEMLQRGGAFKLRGAYTFLAALAPEARARGVVAPSSGNHAQAVALAARLFGVPATVVMPVNAPEAKRRGAERLGARVELAGARAPSAPARADEIVAETGRVLVPPFDHPAIVAGQGTIGLEIARTAPTCGSCSCRWAAAG
jgi:hypothetical protein